MSIKEYLGAIMILAGAFGIACYGFMYPGNAAEPVKMYGNENINSTISTALIKTQEGLYRVFTYSGYRGGGITAVKIK